MTPSETQSYKERLEQEKRRLLEELRQGEKPVDFGDDVDSSDEEADEAEEFGTRLAVGQVIRDRLSEIDGALSRMASGKYGVCTKCGATIGKEVLDAAPESELCESCKKAG